MKFLILSTLVVLSSCRPQNPAGVPLATCPDYPYCSNFGGFLPVPAVPGAGEVIAAQEAVLRAQGVGPVANDPYLAAHAAAEAAVIGSSRGGFPAHAAFEREVLLQQGRVPAGLSPGLYAHALAEQAVRSNENALIVDRLG